jgi:SAM-dependent methyltransferase
MALNRMNGLWWIDAKGQSLLDVGCNVGELLIDAARRMPTMHLAGVDVNATAIADARRSLPGADLHQADGPALPFADASFDHVTCIEVIEHIPAEMRRATMREIWRVLIPGGRFILRCPHRGVFQGLDANNLRFRLPRLYARILGGGRRDAGYAGGSAEIVWHQHFHRAELLDLIGPGFRLETICYGGLLLYPLGDLLSSPFYRLKRYDHPALRLIHRTMEWDIGIDYGVASYCILMVMRKEAGAAGA